MAPSHQRNIPLGKFEYHVFLTHNWGPKPAWENHQRVSVVNAGLAKRGLKTWFDEVQMKGDISRIMTKGVEKSCVVVVFITAEYIRKVDSDKDDNCKFEFYHARAHRNPNNMIPVLMERVDKPWNGPVGAILGYHLYVDMTNGPTEENITELFNMIVHRIEEEVGPCPSPSLASSSTSALLPTATPVTSAPTDSVVDELTTILSNAKLGHSERQALEKILREAGFDDAETILDMTEDHAKQMGIQPGHFIKISKAAKQAAEARKISTSSPAPPNGEFVTITAKPEFSQFSLEELRLHHCGFGADLLPLDRPVPSLEPLPEAKELPKISFAGFGATPAGPFGATAGPFGATTTGLFGATAGTTTTIPYASPTPNPFGAAAATTTTGLFCATSTANSWPAANSISSAPNSFPNPTNNTLFTNTNTNTTTTNQTPAPTPTGPGKHTPAISELVTITAIPKISNFSPEELRLHHMGFVKEDPALPFPSEEELRSALTRCARDKRF